MRVAGSIHFARVWRFTTDRGFAVTVSGRMIWTADGGRTWYDATPAGVHATVHDGVAFAPGGTATRPGWAVVEGPDGRVLLFTRDGGVDWRRLPMPPSLRQTAILGLSFVDALHGWLLSSGGSPAGGVRAVLYHTADGGLRWPEVAATGAGPRSSHGLGSLPRGGLKSGVAFASVSRGWLTGTTATPGRILLLATRDGGRRWSAVRVGGPGSLPDVQLESQPPVFFGHGRGILAVQRLGSIPPVEVLFFATRDGGVRWSAVGAAIDPDPSAFGFVWSFSDPAHGWAADGAHVFATSDGGRRWTMLSTNRPLPSVRQLDFVDAADGWAVSRGRLLGTADGGRTWTVLSGGGA